MGAFRIGLWLMLAILCVLLLLLLIFLDSLLQHYAFDAAPRIIILFHRCGMGNQMFQYAAGLGVAYENPEYQVCASGLGDLSDLAHANSALDLHVGVLNTSGLAPIARCRDFSRVFRSLQMIVYDLEIRLGFLSEFIPPHSTYVPFVVPVRKPVLVFGYMQSFKYFQHVPKPFFRLLQLDAAKLWLLQRNLTSVVHVRRGDKLTDSSSVVPVSYYQNALRILGNSRVAVCTDDVEWVRAQRVFENATVSVGHDPGFDMALLAAATDTVIIGIGTFGWWGAYLSMARRKFFYRIVYQGSDLSGYREEDYIPYDQPGQGKWISLV
jgi:hypothetical protein